MSAHVLTLTLPVPPSANRYWRRAGHLIHISPEARKYRKVVAAAVAAEHWPGTHARGFVVVTYQPHRPLDWARRAARDPLWEDHVRALDRDNLLKPLLDALTHAGVYPDDSRVWSVCVTRAAPHPGGRITVEVTAVPGTDRRHAGAGPLFPDVALEDAA